MGSSPSGRKRDVGSTGVAATSARVGARAALLAVAALVAPGASGAPTPPAGPRVQVRLLAPPELAAGAVGKVAVELVIPPGFHVNSHHPLQKFLIPTNATLGATSGTFSEVRYPDPVKKRFEFSDEPLAVYEGTVRFESELALPATATAVVALQALVSYQPCNASQCYPPAKAAATASVRVLVAGGSGR